MKNFEHLVSIFKSAVIYANAAHVNLGGHESVCSTGCPEVHTSRNMGFGWVNILTTLRRNANGQEEMKRAESYIINFNEGSSFTSISAYSFRISAIVLDMMMWCLGNSVSQL